MRLAVSYFYQIRFFKPYMIPLSTAVWDPKWYHQNKGEKYNYLDSNGVINGLRIRYLRPDESCDGLCRDPETCSCGNPNECQFLKVYEEQLNKIDFDRFNSYLKLVGTEVKKQIGFSEEPLFVFIVHEATTKQCSERCKIIKVLREHGYDIDELQYPINQYY